jgi:hypothetical protein
MLENYANGLDEISTTGVDEARRTSGTMSTDILNSFLIMPAPRRPGAKFAKERDLTPGDNPYCVHDAGYVTQQCQQNIQPECAAEAHLQKYAERRQQNSDQHAKEIHKVIPLHLKFGGALIL